MLKAAAVKKISVEALASEILNQAIQEQFGSIIENNDFQPRRKPSLSSKEPFFYDGTPEESGIPVDEWQMDHDYS